MIEQRRRSDAEFQPSLIWNGVTQYETLTDEGIAIRRDLANYARDFDWAKVLALIAKYPDLVNTSRPLGKSRYAPLHQAAFAGADLVTVTELLRHGAWRALRDGDGNRPVDIARRRSHDHLLEVLEPIFHCNVPPSALAAIQKNFHDVILHRARHLVLEHKLRLPELEVLLESPGGVFWFAIPGMYGGFSYWLEANGRNTILISESWSRVADGSGQRHNITESDWVMVDEGFV